MTSKYKARVGTAVDVVGLCDLSCVVFLPGTSQAHILISAHITALPS